MGLYNDIQKVCETTTEKESATRVLEWLDSPFCPLVPDEELDSEEKQND